MDAETHLVQQGLAEQVEAQGWQGWIEAAPLREGLDLADDVYLDCLAQLERDGYLVVGGVNCATGLPMDVAITEKGFLWVLDQAEGRKTEWIDAVLESARTTGHSRPIAEVTGIPEGAVRQLLDMLEDQGHLRLSKDTGGSSIDWRSPRL